MPADRPNVLLITSEDNGPELGCYGDPNPDTPHIDQLAREGVRFDESYCTQAVCSPGRASILTGLYPHENGQIGLTTHKYRMYEDITTLPTLLHEAGYRTGRLGKLHVAPEEDFAFDMANDPWGFAERDVRTRASNAREFMEDGDDPFFLMVNYRDAHLPWIDQYDGLPEEPMTPEEVTVPSAVGVETDRLQKQAAGYYNCLERLDAGIGMLLEALANAGHAEDTLVIYTADHGSQFSRGKLTSYELGVRIPLIVRWPGVTEAGGVSTALTSQIDVMPTVLDAVGVAGPASVSGKSLRPLLNGRGEPQWRDHLFTEWNASPTLCYPQRTVRNHRYKLIQNMRAGEENPSERYYSEGWNVDSGTQEVEIEAAAPHVREAYKRWRCPPQFELYDLHTDPYEFHNLAQDPEYAEIRAELVRRLERWQTETCDKLAQRDCLDHFIEEHEAALERPEKPRYDPEFEWEYADYLAPKET